MVMLHSEAPHAFPKPHNLVCDFAKTHEEPVGFALLCQVQVIQM